jgi:hypothetical protein
MPPTTAVDKRVLTDSLLRVAATLEERNMPRPEILRRVKEIAQKCGCDMAYAGSPTYYQPLGGAVSFDEADAYVEGQEYAAYYQGQMWTLRSLIDNILNGDNDLAASDLSDAIAQAASDFEERIAAFQARENGEGQADEDEEQDDAASTAAILGIRGTKAGKRMAAPQFQQLQDMATKANDLVRWAGYLNSEDANEAIHDYEDAAANGNAGDVGDQNNPDTSASDRWDGQGSQTASKEGWWSRFTRIGQKRNFDPSVGGGVDRDKISAEDFAGPHRTLPIVKPKDVADAVKRMGSVKGGDTASMKAKIQSIAKRKGAAYVAKLPAAWTDSGSKEDALPSSFAAFKSADGTWRWLAVHSNNFYDKTGEVFPARAHKEYVAWVDGTKQYPELWDWHTPFRMGKADVIDYDAQTGFMISGGYFYPGHEAEAEALAADPNLGVSHGYEYGEKDLQADGSYRSYRTFEISPLPRHRAANNATLFLTELREENMAFATEKRAYLVEKHGEKAVKSMEDQLAAASSGMKSLGVSFKDFNPDADGAGTSNASAANAASASSVSLANAAAGAKDTPDLASLFAEAATVAVKEILQPIADRLTAVETGMKELSMADQERYAERNRPRAADIMDRERPSESSANLVSGPRGGANRAAKDDGLEAVVREANRQVNQKDDGVPANVPDELCWYGQMMPGMFGAPVAEQAQ